MISTILLVDDDDFARHFSRIVLERAGYRIIEACETASALLAAKSERPHLAIVDYLLPDGDGVGLARSLHRDHPELPVLLVSGDISQAEGSTVPGDFAGVIQKPFSPSTLLASIVAAQTS